MRCPLVLGVLAILAAPVSLLPQPALPHSHLLIVVDGLRPDYVTEDVMPNLSALGKRGVVFRRHHAVFPTVTRVNASSISTGSYPETHGLLGNSVFFPRVNPSAFLDTGERGNLITIAETEQRLLTAQTMGEVVQQAGGRMLVVSSGSSGSAFLNNHTVSGGAIIHHQFVLPEPLGEDVKTVGPPPAASEAPPGALDRWAVDALLTIGIPRIDPSVTVLWLSGLDSAAHSNGMGHTTMLSVLRQVDGHIQRIQDSLKTAGLFERYNIWVTSDHGFSTHTGSTDLEALLTPFAGVLADGSPRIVHDGGALYVRDGEEAVIRSIVASLQRTRGIGAIFTKEAEPGSFDGRVAGTLSYAAARWNHDRSGDILFSRDWTDEANVHGFRGTAASGGVAGHGSSSPWDIHNTLIAAGPDLKRGVTIDAPSGNVDFAPTFLELLGLAIPTSVQGRPLDEALVNGDPIAADAVQTLEHVASTDDGSYRVTVRFSTVTAGGRAFRYLDGTTVVRREPAAAR